MAGGRIIRTPLVSILDIVYALALKERGVKRGETDQDPKLPDNPVVLEYYKEAGHPEVKHDRVSWCAAFVGAILHRAGLKPSGSLMARSYLNWGTSTKKPVRGSIVVFSRGPVLGHVAFFDRDNGDGTIRVLGGNQSNAVSLASFPKSRVLGYRIPQGTIS